MIRIGILNNEQIATESIRKIREFRDFKVSGILNAEEYRKSQYALESLLESSDAVFIGSEENLKKDFLKLILRRSIHIFLERPFFPKFTEIKELISLQNEAECAIQIYNPYLFDAEILRVQAGLQTPNLTEIHTTLSEKAGLKMQLLNILLYLSKTDNSGFRKMDVFALQGENQFLLNLHLQFLSGSVCQVNMFVNEQAKPASTLDIYQKNTPPFSTEIILSDTQHLANEKNALKEFAKCLKGNDATILSLNDLHHALIALQEIKEKLKYPNISLSD